VLADLHPVAGLGRSDRIGPAQRKQIRDDNTNLKTCPYQGVPAGNWVMATPSRFSLVHHRGPGSLARAVDLQLSRADASLMAPRRRTSEDGELAG
jgi:hypothetical protein